MPIVPDAVQDKLIVCPSTTDVGCRRASNTGSTPFFSTLSTTSDTSVDYNHKNRPLAIGGGTGRAGGHAPQLSAYRGLAALGPLNWSLDLCPQFDVSFPGQLPKIVATRGEIFSLKFTKYSLAAGLRLDRWGS